MRGGHSVYIQEETKETKYHIPFNKMSRVQEVWTITYNDVGYLRATTPSESPITVQWQFVNQNSRFINEEAWCDDPALTVTSLPEQPICECEITISLSENVKRDIQEPGVVGEYRKLGTYRSGRPVLQHTEGRTKLYVGCSRWVLGSNDLGEEYLLSGSVPSQCPADPRAARNELKGLTHWRYKINQRGYTESRTISIECKKHKHY